MINCNLLGASQFVIMNYVVALSVDKEDWLHYFYFSMKIHVVGTGLLKTTCRETWWWNEHVEKAIAAKQKAFKAWKTGKGTRASYDAAKCIARHAVYHARQEANKKIYKNIDPKSSEVYRLANQFRRENADVVGDKPVKNDAGEMSVSEDSKQKAWLKH